MIELHVSLGLLTQWVEKPSVQPSIVAVVAGVTFLNTWGVQGQGCGQVKVLYDLTYYTPIINCRS